MNFYIFVPIETASTGMNVLQIYLLSLVLLIGWWRRMSRNL